MADTTPFVLDPSQYTILSKEDILGTPDREIRLVPVPEWGERAAVYIKSLDGTERNRHNATMVDINRLNRTGKQRFSVESPQTKLLAFCLCDATGKPLFSVAEVEKLNTKNAKVLERLYDIAQEMSGLGKKAEDEAGNDSEETQSSEPGMSSARSSDHQTALLGSGDESPPLSSPNGWRTESSAPGGLNGMIGAPA